MAGFDESLKIEDYSYNLPDERIAYYPLENRDESRLLIFQDEEIEEDIYSNLDQWIPESSLLVFNNTRVIEARIVFRKSTGGEIEIFCLEPASGIGYDQSLTSKGSAQWNCLIGGASKWKPGQVLELFSEEHNLKLIAKYIEKHEDSFLIQFEWDPGDLNFGEVLAIAGNMPLPPYIKRKAELEDSHRYQTVYSDRPGSVAAPTAGLHFTESLLKKLDAKNILREHITLHVGAGTFRPVKSVEVKDHNMHAEYFEAKRSTLETLRNSLTRNVAAVGTTSLRSLESLYWIGVKIYNDPETSLEGIHLSQWDPYHYSGKAIDASEALDALIAKMRDNDIEILQATTSIMIAPGYQVRMADMLVTNFHQPQSTLLLLVAAFIGESWKTVYQYALDKKFRFLSYGDGCLLFRR